MIGFQHKEDRLSDHNEDIVETLAFIELFQCRIESRVLDLLAREDPTRRILKPHVNIVLRSQVEHAKHLRNFTAILHFLIVLLRATFLPQHVADEGRDVLN